MSAPPRVPLIPSAPRHTGAGVDAAISAVETRTDIEAEVRDRLVRGWLDIEARIRYPWATVEDRAAYVDLNARALAGAPLPDRGSRPRAPEASR